MSGLEPLSEVIGVITLVGDKALHRLDRCQQLRRDGDVADIARRQHQHRRPAQKVYYGMDFRCLPTARGTNGLRLRPPFPPWAERCALT